MISAIPYSLEVVSHHPDTKGKSLKQHMFRGEACVGVLMDEPFEIIFRNNSWQRVAVKLSLDGTDLLTGELASSEYTAGKMWMVEAYGSLRLKAWPETDQGGAALVFTGLNQSVAVHTHGDISSRGIIAAAVFVETAPPVQYIPWAALNQPQPTYYPDWTWYPYTTITGPNTGGWVTQQSIPYTIQGGGTCQGISSGGLGAGLGNEYQSAYGGGITMDFGNVQFNNAQYNINSQLPVSLSDQTIGCCGSVLGNASIHNVALLSANPAPQGLAAVGAGQYTEQPITYSAGLTAPRLDTTLKLRYEFWDTLQEQLRANEPVPSSNGFPADAKRRMSLGNTPRIGTPEHKPAAPVEYQRV